MIPAPPCLIRVAQKYSIFLQPLPRTVCSALCVSTTALTTARLSDQALRNRLFILPSNIN